MHNWCLWNIKQFWKGTHNVFSLVFFLFFSWGVRYVHVCVCAFQQKIVPLWRPDLCYSLWSILWYVHFFLKQFAVCSVFKQNRAAAAARFIPPPLINLPAFGGMTEESSCSVWSILLYVLLILSHLAVCSVFKQEIGPARRRALFYSPLLIIG